MWHRYPRKIAVETFDFARVEPRTNVDTQCLYLVPYGARAPQSPRRAIERAEKPVAGRIDLLPLKAIEVLADHGMVLVE
jgi:hypothetical protein